MLYALRKMLLCLIAVGIGGMAYAAVGMYFFPMTGWVVWKEIAIPSASLTAMAISLLWFIPRR